MVWVGGWHHYFAIVGTNAGQQVFTNCKVFNKFGSAIWYIADYLQAKFERLFQVLSCVLMFLAVAW